MRAGQVLRSEAGDEPGVGEDHALERLVTLAHHVLQGSSLGSLPLDRLIQGRSGEDAGLDPLGEHHLVLGGEERDLLERAGADRRRVLPLVVRRRTGDPRRRVLGRVARWGRRDEACTLTERVLDDRGEGGVGEPGVGGDFRGVCDVRVAGGRHHKDMPTGEVRQRSGRSPGAGARARAGGQPARSPSMPNAPARRRRASRDFSVRTAKVFVRCVLSRSTMVLSMMGADVPP